MIGLPFPLPQLRVATPPREGPARAASLRMAPGFHSADFPGGGPTAAGDIVGGGVSDGGLPVHAGRIGA